MSTEKLPYIVSVALLAGSSTPVSADIHQQPEPSISVAASLPQSTRDAATQNPFRTTSLASPLELTNALESHAPEYVIDSSAHVNQPRLADTPIIPVATTVTVQPGDTVVNIAARMGTSPLQLEATNDLEDPDHIEVGDQLSIVPASDEDIDTYQQHQAERIAKREADEKSLAVTAVIAGSDNPNSPDMSAAAITPDGGDSQLNQASSQVDSMASMNMGPISGPEHGEDPIKSIIREIFSAESRDYTTIKSEITQRASALAQSRGLDLSTLTPMDQLKHIEFVLEIITPNTASGGLSSADIHRALKQEFIASYIDAARQGPAIVRIDLELNAQGQMNVDQLRLGSIKASPSEQESVRVSTERVTATVRRLLHEAVVEMTRRTAQNPADVAGNVEYIRGILDTMPLLGDMDTAVRQRLIELLMINGEDAIDGTDITEPSLSDEIISVATGEHMPEDLMIWIDERAQELALLGQIASQVAALVTPEPDSHARTPDSSLTILAKVLPSDRSLYDVIRRVYGDPNMTPAQLTAALEQLKALNPTLNPDIIQPNQSIIFPDIQQSGNMQPSPGPEQDPIPDTNAPQIMIFKTMYPEAYKKALVKSAVSPDTTKFQQQVVLEFYNTVYGDVQLRLLEGQSDDDIIAGLSSTSGNDLSAFEPFLRLSIDDIRKGKKDMEIANIVAVYAPAAHYMTELIQTDLTNMTPDRLIEYHEEVIKMYQDEEPESYALLAQGNTQGQTGYLESRQQLYDRIVNVIENGVVVPYKETFLITDPEDLHTALTEFFGEDLSDIIIMTDVGILGAPVSIEIAAQYYLHAMVRGQNRLDPTEHLADPGSMFPVYEAAPIQLPQDTNRAVVAYDPSQAPGQAPQVTVDTKAGGDGNNTTDTNADTTAGGGGASPFDPSTMNPEGTPASVATPDTSTLSTPNIQAAPGLSMNSENSSGEAMAFSDGPIPASAQPVRVEASLSQAVASHQGAENSSSQSLTIDQIMDIIKRDGVTIEAMNTWFPGGRGPDPMTVMATGEYIRTHQAEIHQQIAQIDAQYRTASPDDNQKTEWMLSSSNLEYYLNMYNHSGSAGERIAAVIAIMAIAGGTIALSG